MDGYGCSISGYVCTLDSITTRSFACLINVFYQFEHYIHLLREKKENGLKLFIPYQRAPPRSGRPPGSPQRRSDAAGCCPSSGRDGRAGSCRTSQKIHIQETEEGKGEVLLLRVHVRAAKG